MGRAVGGDGRGDEIGLVPVPPVDGGPGHPRLTGHALHRDLGVPDLGQLAKGGVGDGRGGAFVAGPARPTAGPAVTGIRLVVVGDRGGDAGGGHCGAPTGVARASGSATGVTLGTKSLWRTRAKAPTEPMKATTAPMTRTWSSVAENPTR